MRNLGQLTSLLNMFIGHIVLLPIAMVIFHPTWSELLAFYLVDLLALLVFMPIDRRLFRLLYPTSHLYYPTVDYDAVARLPVAQRTSFLQSMLDYPKWRAILAVLTSAVKVIPGIIVVAYYWQHGFSVQEALLKCMAVTLIMFSYFYACVFFESHRKLSAIIATLHERFDWSEAFRALPTERADDLTRHEIASLIGVWFFMLWLLVLSTKAPLPAGSSHVLEILMVASGGLLMASRIWYLGRRNFIEPLKKIFARFESFDPRQPSIILPLDTNPMLARFIVVVNDLAGRIRAYERELAHAVFKETEKSRYRALGQLSALIAHDLSAPLHVMQFCAKTIAEEPSNAVDPRYIAQLTSNAQRAVELVESLKAYLKNPEGRDAGAPFWRSHHNVLRILQIQYEKQAFADVVVETRSDEREVILDLPRQDLIHVLMNLYKNALDNMLQNGRRPAVLRVSTEAAANGCIAVHIEDGGTGLSRARYEEMTSSESMTFINRDKADGLGLRLVRRLVEQHHGKLEVLDEPAAHGGTHFVLTVAQPGPAYAGDLGRAVMHTDTDATADAKLATTVASLDQKG